MTEVRALPRPRRLAVRAEQVLPLGRAVLYGATGLVLLRDRPDTAALAAALRDAHLLGAAGRVPLAFGPETLAAGAPWGGLGWLGSLVAATLTATPWPFAVVGGVSVLVVLLTVAAVEGRARQAAPPVVALGAAALAAACYVGVGAGPGLVTPAAAALLMLALEAGSPAGVGVACVTTVLWMNLAPDGVLAAPLAVAAALGTTFDRAPAARVAAAWAAALGCSLAIVVTPVGFGLLALAGPALSVGGRLTALGSALPDGPPAREAFTVLVLLALGLGVRGRGWGGALPAALGLLLAFVHAGDIPLAGILVAPLLVAGVREERVARLPPMRGAVATAFAVALAAAWPLTGRALPVPLAPPLATATRQALALRSGRVFCERLVWCDALETTGVRVVADGRLPLMPERLRADVRSVIRARGRWQATLRDARVSLVLAAPDATLGALLALGPDWHVRARDGATVLWERTR